MRLPSVAIVVITYKRPQYIDDNLHHLEVQTITPKQVLVVDGSPDDVTEKLVAQHPIATYVRNPAGAGNMTSSRNAALPHVDADVIAFLDDDANAAPDYVERLASFAAEHPDVSIGCCRALNGMPNEEIIGVEHIGTFTSTAAVIGNFAANPGKDVPIDHGLGATMWIRTALMTRMGGFREYFPGTSACEDTDLFLRARRLGAQPWFVHDAVVRHVAAPQEGGQRFDRRYTFYGAHNKAMLLMADVGIGPNFWLSFAADLLRNLSYGGAPYRRVARTGIVGAAWLKGLVSGLRLFGRGPVDPVGGYRRPLRT